MDALLELLLELLLLGFSGSCGGFKGSLFLSFSGVKGSLLLGFSGGGGFKGSLLLGFSSGSGSHGFSSGSGSSFSLCKNGLVLSFSLGNSSLDSLVYCSLLLFLEVFGGDSTELEQVTLVISLLSLVLLKFISELLFSLSGFISELLFSLGGFFQLCF